MKLKNLKALSLLMFGLLFMVSCEYDTIVDTELDPTVEISFNDELIPMFQDNCTGCHGAGHLEVDLTPENAYQDLNTKGLIDTDNPEESRLYIVLAEVGEFHYDKLTPTQKQKILNWIIQGAKDN